MGSSATAHMRVIETFHASLVGGITRFHPGSHFGSRRQALACIGAHFWLDFPARDIAPVTLYRVRIEVSRTEILEGPPQWGAPGAAGVAMEMRALYRSVAADGRHSQWATPLDELDSMVHWANKAEQHGADVERFWRDRLQQTVPKGIKLLRYTDPNVFDQVSPDTFCVIDPAVARVVSAAPAAISDVLEATYLHADHEDGRRRMAAYCRAHRLRTNDWLRGI